MASRTDSWDIFTGSASVPDSLWAGFTLAAGLSRDPSRRVRLFVDSLEEAARNVPGLSPHYWMQWESDFEVVSGPAVNRIDAARTILRVYGAPVSSGYAAQLSEAVARRLILLQTLDASAPGQPELASAELSSLAVFRIPQGDLPDGAGMLKSDVDAVYRHRVRTSQDLRSNFSSAFGIANSLDASLLTVLLADSRPEAWRTMGDALARIHVPAQLVVLGAPRTAERRPAWVEGANGRKVATIFIDPLPWGRLDQLVCVSDLLITNSEDLASRAMRSGCPFLWSGLWQRSGAARALGDGLVRWYLRDVKTEIARTLRSACLACSAGTPEEIALWIQASLERWSEFKGVASGVADRIGMTADLVDILASLPSTPATPDPRTPAFATTIPLRVEPVA